MTSPKRWKTAWWDKDVTPGYILLASAVASFVLLNGPTGHTFHTLVEAPFAQLAIAGRETAINLHLVINDALMAVFFLYVGLELKRETVEGPFKNPREAALPLAGALGGMAAPALVFLAIAGQETGYVRGWGIPMATDIAFAVGVLALLGSRVQSGLRLFLLALAIVDDLGAILVIALFYTEDLLPWALGGAALVFIAMLLMNRAGTKALWPYWALGIVLWGFMVLSGVHATIAGVLTALTVPMRRGDGGSPLITAEHALKPWVQLTIMPAFALTNAGVVLNGAGLETFTHPLAAGIALGLFVGKPLGIVAGTLLIAAVLKQRLPASTPQMVGIGFVAGIGFTMSLFIGHLAFGAGALATPVRLGVLGGSLAAAAMGLLTLWWFTRRGVGDPALAAEERLAQERGVLELHREQA